MLSISDIAAFFDRFAPDSLAADWDNVGLLIGDRSRPAARVMTCLSVSRDTVDEAIDERADLVVSHHPIPFRPIKRLTTDSHTGTLVWRLASAGVSVYSPHTAFDSAARGINQRLAEGLGMASIEPLIPTDPPPALGAAAGETALGVGRMGCFAPALPIEELVARLKRFLKIERLQVVGEKKRVIAKAAIACGGAGDLFEAAAAAGCEAFITGEARFHTCLEAADASVALLLAGHYSSERFAVEALVDELAREFSSALTQVWASRRERDPLSWA